MLQSHNRKTRCPLIMTQTNEHNAKKTFANELFIPEIIKMIDNGHTVTIGLRGYSMRPFLEDGRDKALLTKPGNIGIGDVVLAEIAPKRYALHRVVNISEDTVTLRGDGNLAVEKCRHADIHGFAIGFYRKGSKHMDSTSGIKWRTYSFIWTRLLPIRRYLLFAYRAINRLTAH